MRGLRTRSERLLVWVVHTDMGLLLLRHALGPSSWWVFAHPPGANQGYSPPRNGVGVRGVSGWLRRLVSLTLAFLYTRLARPLHVDSGRVTFI